MPLRDNLRVLVVDDMSTSRAILLQRLDALGILHTDSADDGVEGLQLARESLPDLILSDYFMPGLDGLELLRKIRADPATSKTGFILVSGRGNGPTMETGRDLGMGGFLAKPYTPVELRDCIEAVVGPL